MRDPRKVIITLYQSPDRIVPGLDRSSDLLPWLNVPRLCFFSSPILNQVCFASLTRNETPNPPGPELLLASKVTS